MAHRRDPAVGECHRMTGENRFYLKLHLRSIGEVPTSSLVYRRRAPR